MNIRTLLALLTALASMAPGAAALAQAQSFGFVLEQSATVAREPIRNLVFSPDGSHLLATIGPEIRILSLDEGGRLRETVRARLGSEEVLAISISPDGRVLAAGDAGGTLILLDAGSLDVLATLPDAHRRAVRSVAFTADGAYVVSGGAKGHIRVWTPGGQAFAELTHQDEHDGPVLLLAAVPPGRRVLSVGADRRVVLWDLDTQRALRPSLVDMDVLSAAIDPAGAVLALGLQTLRGNTFRSSRHVSAREIRAEDRLRLIDAAQGTDLRDLEGGDQDLDAVAVTPDARLVASAGSGGWASIWDAATGRLVTRIPFEEAVASLAFDRTGAWLAGGTSQGEISLFRLSGVGPAPAGASPGPAILIVIVRPENVVLGPVSERGAPRVTSRSLEIRGQLLSDAPVESLQVNGEEVTSLVPRDPGVVRFTAFVPLPRPGAHRIEVVARNAAGTTARESFVVERAGDLPPPEPGKGRRIALIVGVSKYADPSLDLEYADDDARALYELVTSPALGPAAFDPSNVRLLIDEEATAANINTGLRGFLQQATENDFVLFYFAGHGMPDPNRLRDLYLLAHDTEAENIAGTGLLMRHVREAIASIRARDVVILTDACHSAGMGAPKSIRSLTVNPIHEVFLDKMRHSSGGLAILTASEAAQVSYEKSERRHGIFTHYLLEGLRGAADEDRDRIVTLGEVMEFVRDRVKQETGGRQIPAIGPTSFDRGLPLVLSGPER